MAPNVIDFDDPKPFEVYEQGKWAGIFQLTSQGAQRLFLKAKPKSIVDMATLTSIYRPGPLAAHVDKLYLKAVNEGEKFEWGDDRINEVLSDTKGCLAGSVKVLTDNGEITIQTIVESQLLGLKIPSLNENTFEIEQDEIVAAVKTGVKETIEIEVEHGVIELTEDHLIMTQRGWVRAGELSINDEIASIEGYTYLTRGGLLGE